MFIRRLSLVSSLTLVCLLAAAGLAAAAPVTNTNDAGAGSLRQAILDAAPGETIAIPAGRYTLRTGELAVEKSINLSGAGPAATVIQASGTFRALLVSGAGIVATLSGVTVRDGDPRGAGPEIGGGIFVNGSSLTLSDVLVTGNAAEAASGLPGDSAEGGGIGALGPNSDLVVRDSTISENVASAAGAPGKEGGGTEGGGVFAQGGLTIERSTVSGNRADARGGQGPASAAQAGGIALGGGVRKPSGGATISASTISENVADASSGPGANGGIVEGGGLRIDANAPTAISNSTIDGNVAIGRGSAIAHGGGLTTREEGGGRITISNSTISDNLLESGALAIDGGNLFSMNTVRIANTIVSGGIGPVGAGNCGGGVESLGFNLDSANECGFEAPGDIVNADPALGPLQDNGGPTATRVPAAGSPAVDRGSAFGAATDQRGLRRPVDLGTVPNSAANGADGSDIGAVELQPGAGGPPPGSFGLGKLTRNTRNGTARLQVTLPGPGKLVLHGRDLRTKTVNATGAGTALVLEARGAALTALRRHGRRQVRAEVTFTATGAGARTLTRTVTLVLAPHGRQRPRARGNR